MVGISIGRCAPCGRLTLSRVRDASRPQPNLFVQSVFVEYSRHVHRIALFAARDILPFEELTYDYGYVVGSVEGKTLKCLCGAPACRGYLF